MSAVSSDVLSSFETLNLSSRDLLQHLSTGEFMPVNFHGIQVSSFGNTRRNPFFKLKALAMDSKIPIEDRMRAVRYLDRIPHVHALPNTIEAACTIIDDEATPIGERYFFFSNHEKHIKLSDHVVKGCHLHFFISTKSSKAVPLILRLLSAQFIYTSFNHNESIWSDVRSFIIRLALDTEETVRIRSEAADILCRRIHKEDTLVGNRVIQELGDLYMKNKMTSIYTNAQNAHTESVTESVMGIIRTLLTARTIKERVAESKEDVGTFTGGDGKIEVQNSGDIYEKIMKLTEKFPEERKNKIYSAFNFILIYPAKYEGITLSDVMCLIWNKICSQSADIRKELEQRFLQELYDIDATCGIGIVSRLVNTLSGYIQEEGMEIKMSIKDQLRANIFARLQTSMRMLPEKTQDNILSEMTESGSKETAREFVDAYSVHDELEDEFVKVKLIEAEEFETIYSKCIDDFLGVN